MPILGQEGTLLSKVTKDKVRIHLINKGSQSQGRASAQGLNASTCKWDKSLPFPFYGQKRVAWQCVSSKRAEKAISPCAQDMDTLNTIWQVATMTTKVYLLDIKYLAYPLSCKQNIFVPHHRHQREENQELCPGPIFISVFMVCG